MTKDTIYLDNAATTWPKPDEVYRAVDMAMREHEPTRAAARTECRSTRNAWSTRPARGLPPIQCAGARTCHFYAELHRLAEHGAKRADQIGRSGGDRAL